MIVFILMVVMLFVPHGVTPFVGEDAIDATNKRLFPAVNAVVQVFRYSPRPNPSVAEAKSKFFN